MEVVGMLLMIVGVIGSVIGGIWFLVAAFQESALWGLGCLFVPLVSLIFLIQHWDKAGKPFLVQLVALVPLAAGALIAGP